MKKIKFNDSCAIKGTGILHGFYSTQYGILAVIEIEDAKSYNNLTGLDGRVNRIYRYGQIITVSAEGIDVINVNTQGKLWKMKKFTKK